MSRVCDIIILNMFEVEQLCRVYKVGDGRVFVECDEWWGVELGSLHKTVREVVRVLRETGWEKVGQFRESGCVQVGWGVGSELVAETTVGNGFAGRRW